MIPAGVQTWIMPSGGGAGRADAIAGSIACCTSAKIASHVASRRSMSIAVVICTRSSLCCHRPAGHDANQSGRFMQLCW